MFGNVVGGGDWTPWQLIPEVLESFSNSEKVVLRHPAAIRPWQHVLEPLSGYLILGMHLLNGSGSFADSWNFGPNEDSCLTVQELSELFKRHWPQVAYNISNSDSDSKESTYLMLDYSKSQELLSWGPLLDIEETVKVTANWYRDYYEKEGINTLNNLKEYIASAKNNHFAWTA